MDRQKRGNMIKANQCTVYIIILSHIMYDMIWVCPIICFFYTFCCLSIPDLPEKLVGSVFIMISHQNLIQFPGKNTNGILGLSHCVCILKSLLYTETQTSYPNIIISTTQPTLVDGLSVIGFVAVKCIDFSPAAVFQITFHAITAGYSSTVWEDFRLSKLSINEAKSKTCKLCRRVQQVS